MLPLVAAAAPEFEEVVTAVGRSLEKTLEASMRSATRLLESKAAFPHPAGQRVGLATVAVGGAAGIVAVEAGGGEGDARPAAAGVGEDRNQPPEYPAPARRAGQEGVVIVLVLSDASGAVEQASVEQSSGFPLLDEAALAAVRRWTFAPALENGVAVAGSVRVPIRFVLRG